MLHGITHSTPSTFLQKLQSTQAAGAGQDPAAASGPATDAFAELLLKAMAADDSATGADSQGSGLELLFGSTSANTAALQQALTPDATLASLFSDDGTSALQATRHRRPEAGAAGQAVPPPVPPEVAAQAATQAATAQAAGTVGTQGAGAVQGPAAV